MKYLVSLVLLLSASVAGAAQREAPRQALRMDRALTAHVVGAPQTEGVKGDEILVLDSFTDSGAYTTTTGAPRTYMGMGFNLDGSAGNAPTITTIVTYLAYTGTAATTLTNLRIRVQLWDTWSSTATPVYSNALGSVIEADVAGPITLNPNTYSPITLTLADPVTFTGLNARGFAVNFQGDTGSGLASSDTLTSLLRYGDDPIVVGANAMTAAYGYRNASARTDFNFLPSDSRSFSQTNEATVIQLYATGTKLIAQSITNFVANPASPTVADGTFTVSATGGASGNPVIFSVDGASTGVCSSGGTNGATITILAAGTCTVLANQAGDATYGAAPQQSLPVTITGASTGLVQDGGFEDGFGTTHWTQESTTFGTPLCDLASCGGVGPRTGDFWAWFGGTDEAEEASLEQTDTIAAGPKALNFYVWWSSSVTAPPDPAAVFNVKIDGTTIFTLTPATAAAYNTGYTLVSVDISAYADGNTHTLRFETSNVAAAQSTNIHLDDISIVSNDVIFENGFE